MTFTFILVGEIQFRKYMQYLWLYNKNRKTLFVYYTFVERNQKLAISVNSALTPQRLSSILRITGSVPSLYKEGPCGSESIRCTLFWTVRISTTTMKTLFILAVCLVLAQVKYHFANFFLFCFVFIFRILFYTELFSLVILRSIYIVLDTQVFFNRSYEYWYRAFL